MKNRTTTLRSSVLLSGLLIIGIAQANPTATDDAAARIRAQSDILLAPLRANVYEQGVPVSFALQQLMISNRELHSDQRYLMLSGCRPRSCDEKAAAVLSKSDQKLVGAALLSFGCRDALMNQEQIAYLKRRPDKKPAPQCSRQPEVQIYIIRNSIGGEQLSAEHDVADKLRAWAKQFGYMNESIVIVNNY
jgi:hypothetical protein